MNTKAENAIDPLQPEYWNKPLWFVYGSEAWPMVLCAMIKNNAGVNIWGYSVWKRQPGFRTLGQDAGAWINREDAVAFADQQHMLDYLKKITTPKVKH
jgi:hypothetical protein